MIFDQAGDVSGYTLVLDSMSSVALLNGDRQRAALIAGGVASLERTTGTGLNASNRQFAGFDPTPASTEVSFTFRQEGHSAVIESIGGHDRRSPLWLAGPVVRVSTSSPWSLKYPLS